MYKNWGIMFVEFDAGVCLVSLYVASTYPPRPPHLRPLSHPPLRRRVHLLQQPPVQKHPGDDQHAPTIPAMMVSTTSPLRPRMFNPILRRTEPYPIR